MSKTNHLTTQQLERLLRDSHDDATEPELAEHLAACPHCQAALDEVAAAPKLWQKASELISEPIMSELAVKRAAASYRSPGDEPTSDLDDASMRDSSTEFLLDPPSHPEMLGRVGDYDIEREVGRGGMGIVYKAFDTELHRPLAVKVLAPWLAQNGTARKRFAREARAAAAVIHPNVISIYGVSASERTPYLVMPYVAGPSLQKLIDEHGPLGEKDIVRIAMQVSGGLGAAHAQGLVHRDIKPANILVEPEVSRVLVTDFGLARAVDDASATHSGYFVGTPNYMSPEQAMGQRVDARSDLFSLGSVIYFMATGRMPFRAESPICVLNRISHDEPTGVQQVNSDISRTLSDVVVKLLEKDPADRFQSAGDVHDVMEKYLAYLHQPDVSKPPVILLRRKASGEKQNKGVKQWLFAAVTVASLIGLLAFAAGRGWLQLPRPGSTTVNRGDQWNTSDGPAFPAPTVTEASATARKKANDNPPQGIAPIAEPIKDAWPKASKKDGAWQSAKLGGSGNPPADYRPKSSTKELSGTVGVPGEFVTVRKSEWRKWGKNIDGYTIYLPESYDKRSKPYPVLFYLQGAMGVGGEVRLVNQFGMLKLVGDLRETDNELRPLLRDEFVIVSPHIADGEYSDHPHLIKEILQEVVDKHQADASRVYLTGLSRGGAGTWTLASRLEGVFAAAAPLAGFVDRVEDKGLLAKTPMWVAHNTGDNFKPIAKVVSKINGLLKEGGRAPFLAIDADATMSPSDLRQSKIFMTGETDDHDAWSRVYSDANFYEWLLQHRRRW